LFFGFGVGEKGCSFKIPAFVLSLRGPKPKRLKKKKKPEEAMNSSSIIVLGLRVRLDQ
jgi:hypothetical protein